ncbi:hypothetical protein GCM10010873_31850 [Cypionkella aquatica]|uniref:Uncharacterized protein n=2 Tax=Cypionkella aquatica TaxID=1756042 RepID=A0AA37UB53_9RHOB|nr:hypothetical protein GCM10010873_31850 [Cypionkella aquatica]
MFGMPRAPSNVQPWEQETVPVSKVLLDAVSGKALKDYRQISATELFRASATCFLFIWAMDVEGKVFLAFEEVLPPDDASDPTLRYGHPRRRGFPTHPAKEKKLGHPTLLNSGHARMAGELLLDEHENNLLWYLNAESGRYCRSLPPSRSQCEAVRDLFEKMIKDTVIWDED